ncbi:VOC family protein [Hyphococcus sp.]|uniref:VOC family protein n=1 Tax=Hyphococcus sp. TaxID=2038636 RepID=UPI002086DFA2|nr:MAG: glyoxalase [Marinicaulis sp.]
MPRPTHFEIHAAEPERAIKFYEGVFGWKAQRYGDMEYWGLLTGADDEPGIHGAIMKRRGPDPKDGQPINSWGVTIEVDNLDSYFSKAVSSGGSEAMAKFPVPGVGWVAYFKDTEGNIVGLHQPDPAAA